MIKDIVEKGIVKCKANIGGTVLKSESSKGHGFVQQPINLLLVTKAIQQLFTQTNQVLKVVISLESTIIPGQPEETDFICFFYLYINFKCLQPPANINTVPCFIWRIRVYALSWPHLYFQIYQPLNQGPTFRILYQHSTVSEFPSSSTLMTLLTSPLQSCKAMTHSSWFLPVISIN